MPSGRDISDFRARERPGARRLSELARSANATKNEFNERERPELEDQPIHAGHLMLSAVEGVGYYTAKFLPFLVKGVDPETDIAADLIGEVGEDVLAVNVAEIGGIAGPIDVSSGAVYCWGHLTAMGSIDGRRVVSILGGPGGAGLTFFTVVKDGGLVGDEETIASLTYTVKIYGTATVLGTSIPVTGDGQRIVKGAVKTDASIGFGRSGSPPVLFWVNEKFEQSNCAPESIIDGGESP